MKQQTKAIILSTYLISSFFVCANASSGIQVAPLSSPLVSNYSQQVVKKARNDRKLSSQTLKALVSATSFNRTKSIASHILHKTKAAAPSVQAD